MRTSQHQNSKESRNEGKLHEKPLAQEDAMWEGIWNNRGSLISFLPFTI